MATRQPTKRLEYKRPVNIGRLHDELMAQVPALRPEPGPGGMNVAVMLLEGGADLAIVTVPDDVDQALIDAVVQAHDPTPDVPPTAPSYGSDAADLNKQAAQAVTQLRTYVGLASPSAVQTTSATKLLCQVALSLIRARLGG